jgi:hypothetical protein
MAAEIESSLIAFASNNEDESNHISFVPPETPVEPKPKRNSNSKHNPSFSIRPQSTLLGLWHMLNTALVGMIPAAVCILSPGNGGDGQQPMFWHDTPWLVMITILGLGSSIILWLIRFPSRYRISRSRLHIVLRSFDLNSFSRLNLCPLFRYPLPGPSGGGAHCTSVVRLQNLLVSHRLCKQRLFPVYAQSRTLLIRAHGGPGRFLLHPSPGHRLRGGGCQGIILPLAASRTMHRRRQALPSPVQVDASPSSSCERPGSFAA